MLNKFGIYKIICTVNNKVYIGSTKDKFRKRFNNHKTAFKYNRNNPYIQEDYNKYGKDSFKYEIIQVLDEEDLLYLEQIESSYILSYKSNNREFGYNIQIDRAIIEETKEKIKNVHIGREIDDNWREAISKTRKEKGIAKGENNPMYGKKHKEETKHAQSLKKIKLSLEQCLEIKQLLLEETNEMWKDKYERISKLYNVKSRMIADIKTGKYIYYKTELNGNYKDWMDKNVK